MIRVLALVLAYCCYCSYSLADGGYTQQYQVGDSGPNSGTITAVTVNSVLDNTIVEMVGGFQETTETWNHTETLTEYRQDTIITTEIVEVITNVTRQVVTEVQTPVTSTQTTETYTSTTTENLAPDISTSNYTKQGRVGTKNGWDNSCSYSGGTATGEACFGHSNSQGKADGGGTITSNRFDIDTNMTQAELNRGFELDYGYNLQSHKSNAQLPLCSVTPGDCKDEFTLTVNIYDSTNSLLNSYVHSTTLNWSNSQSFAYEQTIGSNNYSLGLEAELVMWGVDAGYVQGYYGPIVSDPWLTVTYDIISYVTETITTYVTEQVISYVTDQVITYEEVTNIELVDRTFTTELTDTTTVFTSEYIGDPIADIPVDEVDVGEEFTVEIEDVNGDVVAEFTVEVVEVEAGVVEVQIESTDTNTGMPEIQTVAVVETIQEIETLDTSMDTSMDTSSVADMDISVDSVDSISDLAEVADIAIEVEVEAPAVEVEVAEVETSVESTSEVNTSTTVEDTSTNESASESETNTGNAESTAEGSGETESDTSAESNGDAGSNESTSESGDSGDEGQESEDVQDSGSNDESNEENSSEDVQESSSNVEESVEGDGDSDSKDKGQDGNSDKKDSNKSGSTKTKVKTKISKSPKEIKKATKQAITKKILQQISIAANQSFAAGENLRLVLLATQGNTTSFKEYQTKLPQQSVEWYDDQGIYNNMPQVPDPYGVLFSLAQDGKHNEMVEQQYKD